MKQLLFIVLLLPLGINAAPDSKQVKFFAGDFTSVKQKANQEGKLFFVDFVANYCYLCKLMDETTFTDQILAEYLEGNYIPYKVNVDDFDGYNLKQQFKIKVLPTIIVFNSKGDELARYEESMSASKMIEELKIYDKPENRNKTGTPNNDTYQPKPNPTPPKKPNNGGATYPKKDNDKDKKQDKKEDKQQVEPEKKDPPVKTQPPGPRIKPIPPGRTETTPEPKVENNPKPNVIDPKPAVPKPTVTTPQPNQSDGLFEFGVKRHPSKGFGVQIGVFAQYGNVLKEVERLSGIFDKPILVNINTLEGKTVYKIIVGAFDTRREAIAYRNIMRRKNVDGVIKDLSEYK